MVKFLLSAAVCCAFLITLLGFYNRFKLSWLTDQLNQTRQQAQQARAQAADLEQRLHQTEERLHTQEVITQQERDSRTADLGDTKAKLEKVSGQLAVREGENKALTAALTEAGRNLDQKQRAEDDRRALADRLITVEDLLNQMRIADAKDKNSVEGSVVSINREAQAVTVSLGSDVGISPNSRLVLRKGAESTRELRVVSVEANSCVAQLVAPTPQSFAKVSVGDPVALITP